MFNRGLRHCYNQRLKGRSGGRLPAGAVVQQTRAASPASAVLYRDKTDLLRNLFRIDKRYSRCIEKPATKNKNNYHHNETLPSEITYSFELYDESRSQISITYT